MADKNETERKVTHLSAAEAVRLSLAILGGVAGVGGALYAVKVISNGNTDREIAAHQAGDEWLATQIYQGGLQIATQEAADRSAEATHDLQERTATASWNRVQMD